jgi:ABC-type nickel/cobalt efflux system permease component RcnA
MTSAQAFVAVIVIATVMVIAIGIFVTIRTIQEVCDTYHKKKIMRQHRKEEHNKNNEI